MEWLKEQLSNLGKTFPVIIVKHCWFNNLPDTIDPNDDQNWTQKQADALLSELNGYNIIGLLVGHNDDAPGEARVQVPVLKTGTFFDQFRPGICSSDSSNTGGHFSIVRVAQDSFNIQHSTTPANAGGPIAMENYLAFSKPLSSPYTWAFDSDSNNNNNQYFGSLGSDKLDYIMGVSSLIYLLSTTPTSSLDISNHFGK